VALVATMEPLSTFAAVPPWSDGDPQLPSVGTDAGRRDRARAGRVDHHAITIDADGSPTPWIVQMGYHRGGWYTPE
jgi:hypothetical protein